MYEHNCDGACADFTEAEAALVKNAAHQVNYEWWQKDIDFVRLIDEYLENR